MQNIVYVGDVDWMRNDYLCDIKVGNNVFKSLEHAFQASKSNNSFDIKRILEADTVKECLRIGREINLIDNWEDNKKFIMESLIRIKFNSNTYLKNKLLNTENYKISMKGYNNFWGTGDDGNGEDILGNILMKIRDELIFVNKGIVPGVITRHPLAEKLLLIGTDDLSYEDAESIVDVCASVYENSLVLMNLVDNNDYSPEFISNNTRISLLQAKDAVEKLKNLRDSLFELKLLINDDDADVVVYTDDDDDFEDEDEDEDEDYNDEDDEDDEY